MKTCSKKAKKYSYTKDCKEQPRKSLVTRFPERAVGKYPERNNARILKSNKAVLCMRRVQDRSREKVLHNL